MQIYKFRNCYLNKNERRVVKDGKQLELTPKTFDVLQLLIDKCGEVVTKDEILEKVWNGSFIEEGNLPVHISKLRRLLDDGKYEAFIETVQGAGYRFISPVEPVNDDQWKKISQQKDYSSQIHTSSLQHFDSIAVLPLQNESDNTEIDYLADGLTESFINSLSHMPNLKVIARNTVFRYKNKKFDAKEVGETLGVRAVLTGRMKLIKNNLILSMELVNVADNTQLWGAQFNQPFSDIIKIQEEITSAVSEKLRSKISSVLRNTSNNLISRDSESYRLYLKGKYFLEKRSYKDICKAIECFQKSVSYDPTNIYSYTGTIESYILLYGFDYISYTEILPKISPLITITSKLNNSIDVVQVMYGGIKMYLEWNFEDAEKHLQNALALNSNSLIAHYRYAHLLMTVGRFSEALKELHQTMMIDPLSILHYKRIAKSFYRMGQFENAIMYIKEVLELEPGDYEALLILGASLVELGKHEESLILFQKSLDIHYNIDTLSMFGYVYARSGQQTKSYKVIKQLESLAQDNCINAIKIARIYVALGEKDKAFYYLDHAYDQHEIDLNTLISDPRWKDISQERRFKELVKKVGIPIEL